MERNPVLAAHPARAEEREVEALSVVEARAIMAAVANRRNAVRWQVALTLGCARAKCWACNGTMSISRRARCGSAAHCSRGNGGMDATRPMDAE